MANKQAVSLYADKAFRESIHRICSKYHSLYEKQFNQLSLFDLEDVEQEIWAHLFETEGSGDARFFFSRADGHLKHLIRDADLDNPAERKDGIAGPIEIINFSDLAETPDEIDNYLNEHAVE